MFNSNLSETVDFDLREQELRQLAQQRSQELDQQLSLKDRKLREQDAIIRAQMDKITEVATRHSEQARIIDEYEHRFEQVKDAVDMQAQKHRAELDANSEDLHEWQDRVAKMESKVKQMAHERSDLLSKLKDQQWTLDQELKRSQREVAGHIERTVLDKQNYLKDLDSIKKEIQDRHLSEMQAKNGELIKSETVYTERISKLEKELSRLQLTQIQQRQIEDDLRQKCEVLQAKNESLRLDLFNSGDTERKQSISLQLQVNELRQDVEVREMFSQKQASDWQLKLQNFGVVNERLQLDLQQANERLKHQQLMLAEKTELEVQKVRAALERQVESQRDSVQELTSERDNLRQKLQKLTATMKDMERDGRREMTSLQQKLQEAENNFQHGQRETRATLQLKSKEILNQREELDELASKHSSKQQEVRHLMVQNSMMAAKYEDALQELDRLQQSMSQFQSSTKREDEQLTMMQREIAHLRHQNLMMKDAIHHGQQMKLQLSSDSKTAVTQQLVGVGTPRVDGTTGDGTSLINVDDDQTLLIQSNEFSRGGGQQHPNSTRAKATFQPFSPINSDGHANQKTDSNTVNQQAQLLQTTMSELDQLKQRLCELENENRNLRLKLQAEWNQTQDLQKALFSNNSQSRSADKKQDQIKEELHIKDLQIKKLQTNNYTLQDDLDQAQSEVKQLEKYIVALKIERDRILEVSQNLKIQLLNSEKKEESMIRSQDGMAQDSYQVSPIGNEPRRLEPPGVTFNNSGVIGAGLNHDLAHLQTVQSLQDSYRYFPHQQQDRAPKDQNHSSVHSSFAVQQQNMNPQMHNSLENYAQARIHDVLEQYQPSKQGRNTNMQQSYQEILENFQPNMKMFDQSQLSGMTGMSAEQIHLRSKNLSPTSILKQSNAFSRNTTGQLAMSNDQVVMQAAARGRSSISPESEPQKRNITFGESNRVTFSALADENDEKTNEQVFSSNGAGVGVRLSDEDGLNNIKLASYQMGLQKQSPTIKDSAKAAAQARLQQLKRTYTLAEGPSQMFPLRLEQDN